MKSNSIAQFQHIVSEVEYQFHEKLKNIEIFKCKIILIDGSNLRIQEKYNFENLTYYSYYWLSPSNKLIIGWDCAPHHPSISTYPHHKHITYQKNVHSSNERKLLEVLNFIEIRLLDNE